MIHNVMIIDVESSGVDPQKDTLLEVGAVLWNVEQCAVIGAWSELVSNPPVNAAYSINRIPPALLNVRGVASIIQVQLRLAALIARADVLIAHNADFDRGFLQANGVDFQGRPWICSMDDLEYPRPTSSRALTAIALAHDVGIVQAHRALADCMLLARLFERVAELDVDLPQFFARGLRPKTLVVADVSKANRQLAKDAHFVWDRLVPMHWARRMAYEDTAALPFHTTPAATMNDTRRVVLHPEMHAALIHFGDSGALPAEPWLAALHSSGLLQITKAGQTLFTPLGDGMYKAHLQRLAEPLPV
jgi:DNA polymerase-3 subunit epsilon